MSKLSVLRQRIGARSLDNQGKPVWSWTLELPADTPVEELVRFEQLLTAFVLRVQSGVES